MLRIFYNDNMYSYYYTTGRWAKYMPRNRGYPKKHYRSKGIEDFYNRFLLPIIIEERLGENYETH